MDCKSVDQKAILSFRVNKMTMLDYTTWYDKVPGKTVKWKERLEEGWLPTCSKWSC